MYTLKISKPSSGPHIDKNADSENTFAKGTVQDQEATLATVMLTQLHDTRVENRFHRLILMAEDSKVLRTHPLNRKIMHVGRSRRNHVQIKDPLVSIKHLTVSVSGNTCVANDLDSSNGTFINGERLAGSQVLNDGDEIMLGKTILRFAARQANAPAPSDQAHRMPFLKKKFYLPATAALCLLMVAAIVLWATPIVSGLFAGKALSPADQMRNSTQPTSGETATKAQSPVQAGSVSDLPHFQARPMKVSLIQQALADYSAGRLNSARQTLNALSAAKEQTSEAFQAKQILSMFSTVQELLAQALKAQKQKNFVKAMECWDRLLAVDVELVGDRPSFFAAQAEQKVQTLSYDYALDAFRLKNNEKARQLCRIILQIDPKNQAALALLAKIDPKA